MRTGLPRVTESVSPPGLQRLFRFGAWCFIVVGATHLLVMAVTVFGPPDPAAQRALDAMGSVPTTLPGIRTDLAQLYYGFSVAMALLGIGFGVLSLVVLGLAPGILGHGTALLWGGCRGRGAAAGGGGACLPSATDRGRCGGAGCLRVGAGHDPQGPHMIVVGAA
jgi:hypothetical protein